MTKFAEKRILCEKLEEINAVIEGKIHDVMYTYEYLGDVQAKDWRTGELLWDDEEKTIPKMESSWGDKLKEDLTEEEEAKIEALKKIQQTLEKML